MITVSYGSSFDKAFRRRIGLDKNLKKKFLEKVEIFIKRPVRPSVENT